MLDEPDPGPDLGPEEVHLPDQLQPPKPQQQRHTVSQDIQNIAFSRFKKKLSFDFFKLKFNF